MLNTIVEIKLREVEDVLAVVLAQHFGGVVGYKIAEAR